jgi:hypothetical protein
MLSWTPAIGKCDPMPEGINYEVAGAIRLILAILASMAAR